MKAVHSLFAAILSSAACSTSQVAPVDTTAPYGCITVGPRMVPAVATLHIGDTLRAQVTYNDCPNPPRSHPTRWRSANLTVATVDSTGGLITARGSGTTTINATSIEDTTLSTALVLRVEP